VETTTHTAADLLEEAGRALYGDEWVARLARAIGISAPTLRAWKAGRLHLSRTDDAVKDTLRLLERKRDEADLVATRIKQLINAAP
jgi:transposase-like protein